MRVALLFRTDTHVSDRSPASWKGDYPAEVWSSLEQVGKLARQYDVQAVLDGGDYFHVKAASRNSHSLIIRTAALHREYPCPVYCVEGNHDLAYNDLESVAKQPIGVLYSCGVFHHLREAVFCDGPVRVRVVGVPYHPRRSLADLLALRKRPEDDVLIAVVHALAAEDPPDKLEDFFGEPIFRYADLATDDGPDVWSFGHWHRDQGVVKVKGKTFVNQGALSRGALTHENTSRVPQVSLIECEDLRVSVRALPIQVAPAGDVFDLERKEQAEAEGRSIEAFIQRLQEDTAYDPSSSIEANLMAIDVASEVRDAALRYLADARGQ